MIDCIVLLPLVIYILAMTVMFISDYFPFKRGMEKILENYYKKSDEIRRKMDSI